MRAAWLGISLVVGCGRIGFDLAGMPGDSAPADGLPVLGPFGSPTLVSELNASCEQGITLTADMLEMFWDSNRPPSVGGGDIWTSTRTSPTATWAVPTRVPELSSNGDEDTPRVTGDGLTLYFASDMATLDQVNDIYRSTRASRTSTWSAYVRVPELSGSGQEYGPWVSDDDRYLVIPTDHGGTDIDLWTSSRASTADPWGPLVRLDEVSSTAQEESPWLDASLRILYFARPGVGIMVATRASPTDPFTPPVPVSELDTGVEVDEWLSPDLNTIMFVRSCEIFVATR